MKVTLSLALGSALAFVACSSTTEGTGPAGSTSASSSSTSSSGSTSSSQCRATCFGKASSCSAPDPSAACDSICDGSYTTDQISCLSSKSCAELESAPSLGSLCPPGGTTSSSSGGSSSGSNNGSCVDNIDCRGSGYCDCASGTKTTSFWDCIGNQCVPSCDLVCN